MNDHHPRMLASLLEVADGDQWLLGLLAEAWGIGWTAGQADTIAARHPRDNPFLLFPRTTDERPTL